MKPLHLDSSEATANTVIGILVSLATTLWVFPLLGLPTTLHTAVGITAMYFVTSTVRSFLLRRLFRWVDRPHHDLLLRLRVTWHLLFRVPLHCWSYRKALRARPDNRAEGAPTAGKFFVPFAARAMVHGLRYLWTCDMDEVIFGKTNRDLYCMYVPRKKKPTKFVMDD